ncbi:retrotransposon-related protein [Tanacetum coccineum]
MHILIDNGSTHNFICPDVVESMRLSLQSTKVFKVYIGSGVTLMCENVCAQVDLNLQGLDIKVDLYVLPMQGPDVVLDIQWLQQLGKVTHDYAQQVMEFTLSNTTHTLTGDASLRMKKISLHSMQALLDSEEIYGVYECHGFSLQDEGAVGGASSSTSTVHNEIEQLLVRYESLFQIPTRLPPSRVIDHRNHLLPSTKPVNVGPYRYPHYQKGEMEKLVQEMLNQGIIRFSQSPFSSPVLLVKKKDGSYRFCVDYRALNTVTIKDKFLIPTADEMFNELGGASIFTKLDLRAGHHQIRVHERDIYKTAFRTHEGNYEFLVMPFGLTNAPLTFQATMNRLFSPYLHKLVIVFFDDMRVYSTTLTSHLEHLECVFHCLREHQFYVKRSKCVFGAGELEYLGHIISARGVAMDPKKLLVWGDKEGQAFMILKQRLSTAPLLSLPNFDQAFVIEADASGDEAVYKWRQYLLRRRFVIRTDHKSIKELMQQVIHTPLQQKYMRKLMGFDFSIEYKPGTTNRAADALSRMFEKDEQLTASFMALSQPILGFMDDLRGENETLAELRDLHGRMDSGIALSGFR